MPDRLSRARGALLGQLAGDALGSQVESLPPDLFTMLIRAACA